MTRLVVTGCSGILSDPTSAGKPVGHTRIGTAVVSTRTTVIIPAKALSLTKSRLTPCLSPQERMRISFHMLLHTIRVTRNVLECIVVISRDSALLRTAEMEGAIPLIEHGTNLNAALVQAAAFASSDGADALLVLPSDLPLLTTDDVQTIIGFASDCPSVAITSSCRDGGTNALLLRPPSMNIFAFGPDSFFRHCAAARELGIEPHIVTTDTLSFDLDTPIDWEDLCARTGANSFEDLISGFESSTPPGVGDHHFLDNFGLAS